ncbi:hypothetical protein MPSEU_001022400 [Mayamaea pseudoterrestris]|nr:hypothetical protein MPSEU_001022400 [Mayamaea pseudoterrestris]
MATKASVVTISYAELVAFGESNSSTSSSTLIDAVGKAFGADGLGILAVTNVPGFDEHRKTLLPLAAKLPSLPDLDSLVDEKSLYSTGWSHGKECLVIHGAASRPDTAKGSFYANPLTNDLVASCIQRAAAMTGEHGHDQQPSDEDYWTQLGADHPDFFAPNVWPKQSLPLLEQAFVNMGQTIHQVGCLLAAVCDAYCHRHGIELKLQETLQKSLNAKGRLLHYFAMSDDDFKHDMDDDTNVMWCGWHNDHGSLTGLVPAIYLDSDGIELAGGCPDADAGLYIQSRSGQVVKAVLPPNACAFQIGETSQIQSGGILQATPHAVKPPRQAGITRESFALFMEPEFTHELSIPPARSLNDVQDLSVALPANVLPLKARYKLGQTFGDFHHATVSAFTIS